MCTDVCEHKMKAFNLLNEESTKAILPSKALKFVIAWSFFTVVLCCKDMMSFSSFDSSPYYYFYFGCKIRDSCLCVQGFA